MRQVGTPGSPRLHLDTPGPPCSTLSSTRAKLRVTLTLPRVTPAWATPVLGQQPSLAAQGKCKGVGKWVCPNPQPACGGQGPCYLSHTQRRVDSRTTWRTPSSAALHPGDPSSSQEQAHVLSLNRMKSLTSPGRAVHYTPAPGKQGSTLSPVYRGPQERGHPPPLGLNIQCPSAPWRWHISSSPTH